MRKMRVSGKVVDVYTLSEIAEMSGKSSHALRKLMERNKMPEANFRGRASTIKSGKREGETIPGSRLYTEVIVPELVEWLKGVTRGKTITPTQETVVITLFQSEKERISNL